MVHRMPDNDKHDKEQENEEEASVEKCRLLLAKYPSVQREFFVPRYATDVPTDSIASPVDYRDVLSWKPLMQTDSQGHSQLRFPVSDVVRTVRVVIQGITADGRPVMGVQLIRVQ
jgi:hypothetical protein